MKKIFISQPMENLSAEQIKKDRQEIVDAVAIEYGKGAECVWNKFDFDKDISPLKVLSNDLDLLDTVTAVFFAHGWENSKRCKIEHNVAKAYGIEILCD